jgi:CubicO group peptidase (beta-lactamase class C family)
MFRTCRSAFRNRLCTRNALAVVISAALAAQTSPIGAETASVQELQGLWHAGQYFPAEIQGTLLLLREKDGVVADVGGYWVPVTVSGERMSFRLPGNRGEFRGTKVNGEREIRGFWLQPIVPGPARRFATNVTLRAFDREGWSGKLEPLNDPATFFLPIASAADGTIKTYLRDPERNRGVFANVHRVTLKGDVVRLLGVRRGQKAETVLFDGFYKNGRLVFPSFDNGKSYDFEKVLDESTITFFPRGNPAPRYRYTQPVAFNDGWPVAALEQVGISQSAIEKFVQMLIDAPMESVNTPQIHGVLIARHGKLVLEEYFHGYNRDRPHDTRSAAKSWTSILIGAAMLSGIPIKLDTPVYATMLESLPADLDARKRRMTLEHLISMTAGFDCNEGDESAPGNEDRMQNQTEEPDWYLYTLRVPLVSTPGEKILYCSCEPNLAAGMLEKIANEPLPELFDRLVAQPLQMGTYHLILTPTGTAYGGGGHYFLPRDFMKLPQLMMNGGKWNGVQIVSKDWAHTAVLPMRRLNNEPPAGQDYGYLWNSKEYPYKNRKIRGFFAAGNGGQIFMAIPDLDLAVTFVGGNYADVATRFAQRKLIPEYILPAVN